MDRVKVDSGTELASHVSRAFWRQAVLTSCVLAASLAVIALLVAF